MKALSTDIGQGLCMELQRNWGGTKMNVKDKYQDCLKNIAEAAKAVKKAWNSTMDGPPRSLPLQQLFWAVLELEELEKKPTK